ncbi:hypothetical protein [Cardinium endosymbiont of Nabis limbatus]|uniref:hypothetical protein n=1 Tax=Cardinium endosymbiont of Nabis limbatus TaxID=3066217 RepID=UPI003AF3EC92
MCIGGDGYSTADSSLHIIAIMVGHDLLECIQGVKAGPYSHQLRLAKLTILATGLLATMLTIYHIDLSQLTRYVMEYIMYLFPVIIVPPFILAVFGFRGSRHTALIGMFIGALFYLYLDK